MTYWWFSSSAIRAEAAAISALLATTSVRPPLSSVISRSVVGFTAPLMARRSGELMAIAYTNAWLRRSANRTSLSAAVLAVSAPSETKRSAPRSRLRFAIIGMLSITAS